MDSWPKQSEGMVRRSTTQQAIVLSSDHIADLSGSGGFDRTSILAFSRTIGQTKTGIFRTGGNLGGRKSEVLRSPIQKTEAGSLATGAVVG